MEEKVFKWRKKKKNFFNDWVKGELKKMIFGERV